MERKKRSKSKTKIFNQENGEKFHALKTKLKKTFNSKTFRSLSIPRSNSSSTNKILSENANKFSKHKSNNPSPTLSTDEHIWFSRMTQSNISNGSHEHIELNSIYKSNSNSHLFINQMTNNKFTYCDVCNQELISIGSVIVCKYCQVVCHEKCCKKIQLPCQSNRLSVNFENLKLNSDIKINQQINGSEVKLRNKVSYQDNSPNESAYFTCQSNFDNCNEARGSYNFYLGGLEPINSRDSLVSVTSISSISSMASQVSYDFTTLDHDSIKMYGIQVKPINQRATALIENSCEDISTSGTTIDLNSGISLVKSDSTISESLCKPSFIYNDKAYDILKIDWTIQDLIKKSEVFNLNNFGLTSEIKYRNGECFLLGTVRVHINLLRPIQMEFSSRPSSIFDVINFKENEERDYTNSNVETLWLPRGTSKRLYVNHFTNTTDVINGLLKKFYIKANPKKFGLYEHTIEGERCITVRKLVDHECPLGTILLWTEGGGDKLNEVMLVKRLVLQENETGDIEWTGFSKPELKNFLNILNREEEENKNKIKLKYSILKNEIQRLEKLISV